MSAGRARSFGRFAPPDTRRLLPDRAARGLEGLTKKIWALKAKPNLAQIYNAHERYKRWQTDAKGQAD